MRDILFIAHRIPFPPDRGDKIRAHHVLKALAAIAPVHVACFADEAADEAANAAAERALAALAASYCLVRRRKPLTLAGAEAMLRRLPISLTAFHDSRIADYVAQKVASGVIGAIYVFSGQMGQYAPPGFAGRLIVDFVDVDSAKFAAYAREKGAISGWIDAREAWLLRAEEARLAARADASLFVSRAEAALFAGRLSAGANANPLALANGIDAALFDPVTPPDPRLAAYPAPRLIFTGQMDYPPNIAAARRAARRILPLVRAAWPEASLHIVGRAPSRAVMALAALPGVHVWGQVPAVAPLLRGADIALVPLELARGVQNKVLEAMAMARPVVLTRAAATGIDAQEGTHFLVAESDAALAEAVIALAGDRARAMALGLAARRFVVEQMRWAQALAPLRALITGTAGGAADAA